MTTKRSSSSRLADAPKVTRIDELVTVLDEEQGVTVQLGPHNTVGCWTLMAHFELEPGHSVAVFENLQVDNGSMLYVDESGVILSLAKTLEATRIDESNCYRGHAKEEVLGDRDILREEILALGQDPTYDEVAACFPPIRHVRYGDREGPRTFVGSRNCVDVVPVFYRGWTGRVHPQAFNSEIGEVIEQESIWEGLVGGWLPVVRFSYPVRPGLSWDYTVFGEVDPPTAYLQPAWYRFLRLEEGRITEAHYADTYLPYPWPDEPPPERFYAELYKAQAYWEGHFEGAMQIEVPEAWVSDFCRHALVQEMITRIGDHPRYGVVDRGYGGPEHDGFQDVLNSAVNAHLEWGLFDTARGYLDNYLTHFVRADGSVDYRGPEISQYARTLTNLAQYWDYTGDSELLSRHHEKIEAILRILLVRREEAKQLPEDDPAYGMIAGRHEADISFVTPTLATLDYEQPYFCNSTEAWRAMIDLGRVWAAIGERSDEPELTARGQALVDEASSLRQDVHRAIERSVLSARDMPYLPLIAGSKEYHLDAPYRSRPESFDDNRVWSEMMHSGMIRKETIDTILNYQSTHNGTTLGIFTNRRSVVAFQCYGEAYGLLQHDMIHEFLLFLYAHATHLHTRGTWSAFECVGMDRDQGRYAPYCGPAQVTIPAITKWMLVFEDPLSSTLWLAKATPRAWLEDGEHVHVSQAPTRWGSVSYGIVSRLAEGAIEATITWPEEPMDQAKLRIRRPGAHPIESVKVDGVSWHNFDPKEETITLCPRSGVTQEVIVRYPST